MFTDAKGSIHNDAVAGPLGFRGGTVPGSVHLDQFVPHLVDIYGERWFQRGGISMFFTQPTVDNEAVRVTVSPGADRATLRMENAEGATICEGTAACEGVDEGSELARRMAAQTPADRERLRILSEIKVGDEASGGEVSIALEALRDGLTVITEDLAALQPRQRPATVASDQAGAPGAGAGPGKAETRRRAVRRAGGAAVRRAASRGRDLRRRHQDSQADGKPKDRERLVRSATGRRRSRRRPYRPLHPGPEGLLAPLGDLTRVRSRRSGLAGPECAWR